MIRRLRLKFVLMNMAFVTALLAAVFGLVLHWSRPRWSIWVRSALTGVRESRAECPALFSGPAPGGS